MDLNKDCRISKREFLHWLKDEAGKGGHGSRLTFHQDEMDAIWATCDIGDEGTIDVRDFVALCVGAPDMSHLDYNVHNNEDRTSQWEKPET